MKRMKQNNFGRFYCLIKGRPEIDKESVVQQFTDGRTTSLKEMYRDEYEEMCNAIEGTQSEDIYRSQLKRARSSVLLRLQRLGIRTVDNWDGIDAFCLSQKIAGKRFAALSVNELTTLIKKLETIIRKGGLKSLEKAPESEKPTAEKKPLYIQLPASSKNKYLS